jgi:hypothetical protein
LKFAAQRLIRTASLIRSTSPDSQHIAKPRHTAVILSEAKDLLFVGLAHQHGCRERDNPEHQLSREE